MASKKPAPPTEAASDTAQDRSSYVGDEHWGKGGRYVIDPATGARVPAPAEPTKPQQE